MFFFARILQKIAGFIIRFFTRNRPRNDRRTLDRQAFNQDDGGEYETLNSNPSPSPSPSPSHVYNHGTHLANAEFRIEIHGENYKEKSSPSKSTSEVGNLPLSIKPSSSSDSNINNSNVAQIKPVSVKRILEETHEVYQKPKAISPLPPPPPPHVLQSKSIDPSHPTTKKPVDLSLSNTLSPFSSQPPPFSLKPAPSSSAKSPPHFSSVQPPQFSSDPPSSSSKLPSSCSKPTLSPLPSNQANQQTKINYVCVEKGSSPIYVIPEELKDLIKKDVVPGVLKKPLSPSTYKDYFAALLYAEDFYIEKWNDFKLSKVTLELHEAAIYKKSDKKKYLNDSGEKDDKTFVVFEMDSVRERRPFLLSRDFVFVRPSWRKVEPYQGIIYRVVKSTLVLVEFGEDFYSQHYPTHKYDISFSFNRFCLKRAHQAVEAASDPLFRNFLFPNSISRNHLSNSPMFLLSNNKLDFEQTAAILRISRLKSPPPYLVEGPLSVIHGNQGKELSRTGLVVREAVVHLYRTSPESRILVCAPTNGTCDVLMRSLKTQIRESDMFRANAAFRELDGVPYDILPSCLYKDECFVCPSLQELRNFNVILSTYVSSFRLHGEGITAGHFSHIFLLDASSATEPELMVALANLANEKTGVVVTGAQGNRSGWVRSDIGRQHGLRISYFERLCESKPYKNSDPMFITRLVNTRKNPDDTDSVMSFS